MIRHKAIRLASYVAARSGLLTSLHQWNGRRGGIILAFHDVSRKTLTNHLDQVAESYEFISLTAMVKRITKGRSTSGLAAITFDDGLEHVIESAADIAHHRGWPMTFFLPTGALDHQQPFWFQEIDSLLLRAAGRTLVLDERKYELRNQRAIRQIANALDVRFKSHTTEEQSAQLLENIRRSLFGSPSPPPGLRIPNAISWKRVYELARLGELSFESHSITHRATSRLASEILIRELAESKKHIEGITGRKVEHFCYPYGGERDIGPEAPQLVRKLFLSGSTMARGRCSPGNDLAMLPRMPLYEGDREEIVALKIGTAR